MYPNFDVSRTPTRASHSPSAPQRSTTSQMFPSEAGRTPALSSCVHALRPPTFKADRLAMPEIASSQTRLRPTVPAVHRVHACAHGGLATSGMARVTVPFGVPHMDLARPARPCPVPACRARRAVSRRSCSALLCLAERSGRLGEGVGVWRGVVQTNHQQQQQQRRGEARRGESRRGEARRVKAS